VRGARAVLVSHRLRVKFAPGSSEGSSYVEISVVGAGGRILN